MVRFEVLQTDPLQVMADPVQPHPLGVEVANPPVDLGWLLAELGADGDVPLHRPPREETGVLEDQGGLLLVTLLPDEIDPSRGRPLQTGDDAEECALAAAVGADHGVNGPTRHHQVETGQDPGPVGVGEAETGDAYVHCYQSFVGFTLQSMDCLIYDRRQSSF